MAMEITRHKLDKAAFTTFENIYDDKELSLIWQEAEFLCYSHKLLPPSMSGSALNDKGDYAKQNSGIWMDQLYVDRSISNYLGLYKKPLNHFMLFKDQYIKEDLSLKGYFYTSADATLMSYYETGDHYDVHIDMASYTYIFWLFKEPKKFTGGDLHFTELDTTITVKSNMGILFPSWLEHKVDKIEMCDRMDRYNANGRFAFSTFFHSR
jgi:hypothetical protein